MKARASLRKKVEVVPGFDGRVLHDVAVRVTSTRHEKRAVRSRPGSFEWRYNRDSTNLTALYHAGVRFAELWETAGTASAGSPGMEFFDRGGWTGIQDNKLDAMDILKAAMVDLGKVASVRLTDYCVRGMTTGEIAIIFGVPDRDMAAVLHQDLRACAVHFRYI